MSLRNIRDFSLVRAQGEDWEFVWECKRQAYRAYVEELWGWDESWQLARFHQFFEPSTIQMIQAAGENIGFLGVEEEADRLILANIVLKPEFQGKGIGTQLLLQLLQKAQNKGLPVTLRVLKNNHKARNLYERLGFWVEGESETHDLMRWNPPNH